MKTDSRRGSVKSLRALAAGLCVFGLLLAACSSPGSPQAAAAGSGGTSSIDAVLSQIKGLSGQARTDKLVELAKAEGNTLTLYTSVSAQVAHEWEAAFEKQYGIHVESYLADQLAITRRIIQEVTAGHKGGDVVESSGIELAITANANTLASYSPPNASELVDNAVRKDWIVTRNIQYTLTWNTNKVKPSEVPTSWEDLADPKWKGKLAIDLKDVDWYQGLWNYWTKDEGKSPADVDALFTKIFSNARVTSGHTSTTALLGGGEYSIYPDNYRYIAQLAIDKGAPLAYSPRVQPIGVQPNGIGVIKNAPHPATALLFTDWLLSESGQQVIVKNRLTPALKSLIPAADAGQKFLDDDVEGLVANYQDWQDRYAKLVAGAGK